MNFEERRRRILKAVVDEYIETAEPVGSKTLAAHSDFGLSSATIRNIFSELEALGLLEQPHASSGRVPSTLGYRLYVDKLMNLSSLSGEEMAALNQAMRRRASEVDRLLAEMRMILSAFTNYAAFSVFPRVRGQIFRKIELIYIDALSIVILAVTDSGLVRNRLIRLHKAIRRMEAERLSSLLDARFTGSAVERAQLTIQDMEPFDGGMAEACEEALRFLSELLEDLDEDEMAVDGAANLLRYPEYRDIERVHRMFDFFGSKPSARQIVPEESDQPLTIKIGDETGLEPLRDASVITATYHFGENATGYIGIVGPKRMDYAKVAARLHYFVENFNQILHETHFDDGQE